MRPPCVELRPSSGEQPARRNAAGGSAGAECTGYRSIRESLSGSVPGTAGRLARPGGDQLAVRDGVHDLLDLLGLLAVGVGLGVAGHAHHAGGDALVAHDREAADDVALLPAHALDVEEGEVDLRRLAAPSTGLVVGLLGLADGAHVLAGRFDAHAE